MWPEVGHESVCCSASYESIADLIERFERHGFERQVVEPPSTEHRNLTFVLGVSRQLEDVEFRRRSDPYHRQDEALAVLQHLVGGVEDVTVERDEPLGVTRQDGDVVDTTQEHDGSVARISKPFDRRWLLHGAQSRSSSSGDWLRSRRYDLFVWVLEGKATDPGEVGRELARWTNEFGDTPGYLGSTGGVTDDSRFLLFVRWESEEEGNELLMRPAQLAWYDEFQRSFDGAVEFAETADVTTHLAGGSDAAGFVQAMKVSGVDRQRIDAADREFESIAPQVRPDLIGGIRVWTAPDGFVEANYFTSEHDARAGESKNPPPELAEALKDFMAMMKDAEYYDFTEPFVHSAPNR